MTITPHTRETPPLVTFALFAYNQEKYIGDAVQGALAQTYEPLEIILSDDCSNDRTFEIMREMVAAYDGPHMVHCRQTKKNIGVLNHVLSVMRDIKGSFVVLAAGDDISQPHRSAELARAWNETGGWAFFSNFDSINSDGLKIEENRTSRGNCELIKWFAPLGPSPFVHGATSAYDARLFEYVPHIDNRAMAEDGFFYGLLRLLNHPIICVPVPLVAYRQHGAAISNNTIDAALHFSDIRNHELKIKSFANTYIQIAELLEKISENNLEIRTRFILVQKEIHNAIIRFSVRRDWVEMSILARLKLAIRSENQEIRRFIAPRIFGLFVFCSIKSFYRHINSLFSR